MKILSEPGPIIFSNKDFLTNGNNRKTFASLISFWIRYFVCVIFYLRRVKNPFVFRNTHVEFTLNLSWNLSALSDLKLKYSLSTISFCPNSSFLAFFKTIYLSRSLSLQKKYVFIFYSTFWRHSSVQKRLPSFDIRWKGSKKFNYLLYRHNPCSRINFALISFYSAL